MKRDCKQCLWCGQCFAQDGCEYFTFGDELSDEEIEQMHAKARLSYQEEWYEYIKEDESPFNF